MVSLAAGSNPSPVLDSSLATFCDGSREVSGRQRRIMTLENANFFPVPVFPAGLRLESQSYAPDPLL